MYQNPILIEIGQASLLTQGPDPRKTDDGDNHGLITSLLTSEME